MSKRRVGVVGGRGYTGRELLRLLSSHPDLEVAYACSRSTAGQRVSAHVEGFSGDLAFEDLDPRGVAARDVDAIVLALPNGEAPAYVEAIDAQHRKVVIVDLSADHRFDDRWTYGLPELAREGAIAQATRIANPGCYATGMQVGIRPVVDLLAAPPSVFGVSGYSGAGTTPSPKNDPELLRDNLMPYSLIGHVHEREVTRQLGHAVRFMPHVAPFFRGITLTISLELEGPMRDARDLQARYERHYADKPLIHVQTEAPWVRDVMGKHDVFVGGFTVDASGTHAVVVVTLDNLLKGAATQALQNLNLSLGLGELSGVA